MVYIVNSELYHHGILGQKWGRRRYQNEDGSYKPGAEGRYYDEVKDRKGLKRIFKKKSSADVEEAVKKEKQLNELERMRSQNAKYRAETERIVNEYRGQSLDEVIQGKSETKKKGLSFAQKAIIGGALIAGGAIIYKKFSGDSGEAAKKTVTSVGSKVKDAAKPAAKKAAKSLSEIVKESAENAAKDTTSNISKEASQMAMDRLMERTKPKSSIVLGVKKTESTEKPKTVQDVLKNFKKPSTTTSHESSNDKMSKALDTVSKMANKSVEAVKNTETKVTDSDIDYLTRRLMGFMG